MRLIGLGLLIILFLLDWFDGYVARLRNEVTEIGAVLDIALDRSVENILWITFMYLGMVPLWVPIIFLIRSFVVDGIRGAALTRGKSGFGMMHSPVGRFLVASRFMRALYGLAKGVIFGLLYLTWALAIKDPNYSDDLASAESKPYLLYDGALRHSRPPGNPGWPHPFQGRETTSLTPRRRQNLAAGGRYEPRGCHFRRGPDSGSGLHRATLFPVSGAAAPAQRAPGLGLPRSGGLSAPGRFRDKSYLAGAAVEEVVAWPGNATGKISPPA